MAKEIAGESDTVKVNVSQVAIGVASAVTSLVGNPMYYQHLLFARKARDKHIAAGAHSP